MEEKKINLYEKLDPKLKTHQTNKEGENKARKGAKQSKQLDK